MGKDGRSWVRGMDGSWRSVQCEGEGVDGEAPEVSYCIMCGVGCWVVCIRGAEPPVAVLSKQ